MLSIKFAGAVNLLHRDDDRGFTYYPSEDYYVYCSLGGELKPLLEIGKVILQGRIYMNTYFFRNYI